MNFSRQIILLVALIALSANAGVVSSVGDDALGNRALDEMRQLGVENKWTVVDRIHPTGTVTVPLMGGQPSYTIHEGVAWDYIHLGEVHGARDKRRTARTDAEKTGDIIRRIPLCLR